MNTKIIWVEVWIDDAARGDYVLLLRARVDGMLEMMDPQAQRQLIKTFHTYEEAVDWLREDEYDLVEGRWQVEE